MLSAMIDVFNSQKLTTSKTNLIFMCNSTQKSSLDKFTPAPSNTALYLYHSGLCSIQLNVHDPRPIVQI